MTIIGASSSSRCATTNAKYSSLCIHQIYGSVRVTHTWSECKHIRSCNLSERRGVLLSLPLRMTKPPHRQGPAETYAQFSPKGPATSSGPKAAQMPIRVFLNRQFISEFLLVRRTQVLTAAQPQSQNPTSFANSFRIRIRRSGRVVKAFDSNDLLLHLQLSNPFGGKSSNLLGVDIFLFFLTHPCLLVGENGCRRVRDSGMRESW